MVPVVVQWAPLCALGVMSGLACWTRHVYRSRFYPYYYVYESPSPHLCVYTYAYVLISIINEHTYTLPYILCRPVP